MTGFVRIVKGLGALAILLVLVVGIPWALWHFVGWPFPHHLPSARQVGRALNHQGIPAQTLVDALAFAVWLSWLALMASLVAEIPAALSGRRARHLPVASALQPMVGWLVAAVVVAGLSLAPRPGQSARVAGGLAPALTVRSVPTLVIQDTSLTSDATAPSAPTSRPGSTSAPVAQTAPPVPAAPVTYVVQRGDTLWGIAQEQLGDPLRWSEIFALNEGRSEPGGLTLTDPHWIDPGWTLVLPATAVSPPPSPSPAVDPSPSTPAPTSTSPPVSSPPGPSPAPATTTVPHSGDHHSPLDRQALNDRPGAVELPTGSVVAGSFAAGVAFAVAMGRLRRRHSYRYRPPGPARTATAWSEHRSLSELRSFGASDRDGERSEQLRPPIADFERRQRPGRLEVGRRDGALVTIELTQLNGAVVEGESGADVVRALITALVVRAGPGAAEVVLTETLATELLPDLDAVVSVRRPASLELLARALEAERMTRGRWLHDAEADDAETFRAQNPEHPFPILFALVGDSAKSEWGRLTALAQDAPRFGMAVLFVGAGPDRLPRLRLDASRRVVGREGLGELDGVEMFGLGADEAVAVLSTLAAADTSGADPHENPSETTNPSDEGDSADSSSGIEEMVWPASGVEQGRPVAVRMFGHLEVVVGDEIVASGLRRRARDLLVWYMLHPGGSTSDEAVDALWPDTEPDRVHGQFWRSFSDLRSCLRSRSDADLEVLTKIGEHYRPAAAEIDCDLWTFQAALTDAAETSDPAVQRRALGRVVEVYRGDLLASDDRPWIEPVRQNLHRRALDAHLRLAELESDAGRDDAAVQLLEQSIERDRYAEEPYRRLMMLHGTRGRVDAVQEVWRLLQARLAELDLDVEDATATLYRQLTSTPAHRERARRTSANF